MIKESPVESQFEIRIAKESDSSAIASMIKDVYDEFGFGWFPDSYHADLYDLKQFYFDKGALFWVACSPPSDNGQVPVVLGTIALEFFDKIPGFEDSKIAVIDGYERVVGADCAINRLYVSPQARRLGIASQMMKVATMEAIKRNRGALELWSDKRFENAHSLYLKLGAVMVGDRICHDPEQSPEYGLKLDLSKIVSERSK